MFEPSAQTYCTLRSWSCNTPMNTGSCSSPVLTKWNNVLNRADCGISDSISSQYRNHIKINQRRFFRNAMQQPHKMSRNFIATYRWNELTSASGTNLVHFCIRKLCICIWFGMTENLVLNVLLLDFIHRPLCTGASPWKSRPCMMAFTTCCKYEVTERISLIIIGCVTRATGILVAE